MVMKVLTLHQPWASLVAHGVKSIETRSWSTKHRGPLAIHAAVKRPSQAQRFGSFYVDWGLDPSLGALTNGGFDEGLGFLLVDGRYSEHNADGTTRSLPSEAFSPVHLGAIVATCTLVDVAPIGRWDGFRTGVFEGDEGDLPGRPVVVNHGPMAGGRSWSLVLDHEGRVSDLTDQLPYGDFTPGRYAWLLADVVPVDPPVPFKGGQGLTKTWTP